MDGLGDSRLKFSWVRGVCGTGVGSVAHFFLEGFEPKVEAQQGRELGLHLVEGQLQAFKALRQCAGVGSARAASTFDGGEAIAEGGEIVLLQVVFEGLERVAQLLVGARAAAGGRTGVEFFFDGRKGLLDSALADLCCEFVEIRS